MDVFTSKEVCNITRIQQRILILFCEKGIIHPLKDAAGQGTQRLFSFENIVEAMVAVQMWRLKIGFGKIKNIVDILRSVQSGEVLVLRNFVSDYQAMTVAAKSQTGELEKIPAADWVIVGENDPSENWRPGMQTFSTLTIDISGIKNFLKKKIG
jgi:DNA-binding transcriptional MerR regulator